MMRSAKCAKQIEGVEFMKTLTLQDGREVPIEIRVQDFSMRGDIFICRIGDNFQAFIQIVDAGGYVVEESSRECTNLSMVVTHVAKILIMNADNHFYDE